MMNIILIFDFFNEFYGRHLFVELYIPFSCQYIFHLSLYSFYFAMVSPAQKESYQTNMLCFQQNVGYDQSNITISFRISLFGHI